MICLTLIVHNEADILPDNLAHHLAQGVDRIFVIDNESTDGTADVLSEAARGGAVEVVPCADREFDQKRMGDALVAHAVARGASWILPNDADEFWTGTGGLTLAEVLGGAGDRNVINAPRLNIVGDRDALSTQDWREVLHWRATRPMPKAPRIADPAVSLGHPYFYHALPPKVAFRPEGLVDLAIAAHKVLLTDPRPMKDAPVTIRHFPVRSRAEFEGSVRRRAGQVLRPDWPKAISTQYQRWAKMTRDTGCIAAAFAETLPDAARLADDIATGAVTRVDTGDIFGARRSGTVTGTVRRTPATP